MIYDDETTVIGLGVTSGVETYSHDDETTVIGLGVTSGVETYSQGPINFPDNPEINDQYTYGATTWTWNGISWNKNPIAGPTGPTGPTGTMDPITYVVWIERLV